MSYSVKDFSPAALTVRRFIKAQVLNHQGLVEAPGQTHITYHNTFLVVSGPMGFLYFPASSTMHLKNCFLSVH